LGFVGTKPTVSSNVVIADAGTIGSASDEDAIAIAADGSVTFTQDIELGHASDTTIARASAGQITVEGTAVLLAGAQTGITTILNASTKIGRDSDNLIDFATTDNKLIFRVEGVNEVELVQNALSPVTSDGVALGTTSLMWSDLFIADGGVVNFNNGDVTLTHSSNTLTIAGGNLAATISTASQPNITTLAGLTTIGAVANALAMTFSDVTLFHDANNADTSFSIGTSATEALKIEVLNGGSNKTAEEVHFSTATASGTADHGKMVFDIDGTDIFSVDDNGVNLLADSSILSIGADNDATLTHDGTTGLTIAATPISIDSTGELHLNSTTGDIKLQDGGTDQITFDLDGTAGEVIMKPAVDSDDLVISQYDGTEVIRIEDNASLGLVGNKLSIANSSSDVVIKPLTDAKDIIFQQYDGTEVARIEDNATFNVSSAGKFAYAGTAVTATAAELNLLDGGTSVGGSITLADADGVVVNDGGTMKTIPASDIKTYASGGGTFDAVADGAISAGDLVGIDANGKVSALQGSFNGGTGATSTTELIANATDHITYHNVCWDPDNSKGLFMWLETASQYDLMGVVLTKSADGTISAGTEQVIHNGSSSDYAATTPLMAYDTNVDRFAVVFTTYNSSSQHNSAIRGVILDIDPSDNSIDAGTTIVIDGADGSGFGSLDVGAQGRNRSVAKLIFMTGRNKLALFETHGRYDSGGSFITASGSTQSGIQVSIMTAVGGGTNSLTVNSMTTVTTWSNADAIAWDSNVNRLFGVTQMGAVDDDVSGFVMEHDASDDSVTVGTLFDISTEPTSSSQISSTCIYWSHAQKVFVMSSLNDTVVLQGFTVASSGQSATASSETKTIKSSDLDNPGMMTLFQMTAGNFANHLGVSCHNTGTTYFYELFTYDSSNVGVEDGYEGNITFRNHDAGINVLTDGSTFSILGVATDDTKDLDYITPSIAPETTSAKHYSRWCGIANSAISDTATGTITSIGGVGTGQSSLTPGTWYQIDNTGSLATLTNSYTDASYAKVGFATSATTIFITGGMSD